MSIFVIRFRNGSIIIDESEHMQLIERFVSQSAFIQSIFPGFMNDIEADERNLSILQLHTVNKTFLYAKNIAIREFCVQKSYGKVE